MWQTLLNVALKSILIGGICAILLLAYLFFVDKLDSKKDEGNKSEDNE